MGLLTLVHSGIGFFLFLDFKRLRCDEKIEIIPGQISEREV